MRVNTTVCVYCSLGFGILCALVTSTHTHTHTPIKHYCLHGSQDSCFFFFFFKRQVSLCVESKHLSDINLYGLWRPFGPSFASSLHFAGNVSPPEYKNEYVQEMESTMNDKAQLKSVACTELRGSFPFPCSCRIKARFQTRQGSYREKSEKLKKKIEKLDEQLRQAKENPVDTHTWKQKGMASIRSELVLKHFAYFMHCMFFFAER